MSIKNTRVRLSDIKQGRTFYTAHPVYGIEKWIARSKPFMISGIGLFVKTKDIFGFVESYDSNRSLNDAGIIGRCFNGRRTFRKLKQAEQWVKEWVKEPSFIKQQEEHERFCALWDELDAMYDDDDQYFDDGEEYDNQ